MTQISILGCGWLGLPLAKSLIEKGFWVNGSTTSLEKIAVLKNEGITAFQIEVTENEIIGNLENFLKNSAILILDIPPKLRGNQPENFVKKIKNILSFVENSSVQKVLFISSTSVYADDNSKINEETKPQPETESGKQLLEVENLLKANSNFQTTIIRFGGLIGDDRNPIHFLAGRKNIQNPDAPINIIHLKDCIGVIESVIEKNIWNETFNAVCPFHPTRKDYYTQKAIALNLPIPEFDFSNKSIGKIISSTKTETVLNYTFQKTNL
ncbi:MAG TPA: NAD(P)H-binding protein [Flavobacterium sp.]|jgi:nucleoside-diphosphate-sugar epimerase|uniref:NAD(P)H-binding protein n=1 Tax=Flavobacterium sp. TaxID=239 RepID=UPI002C3541E8|nr:NAD(P)H-binding protein [Flavobacterium sp.]HPW98454.1 NAD(P)H-binding protein [Flavobacterium sp.]HQA73302.1 NAD(P)H-binding protein [Flavobacterium sp.]